jgi:hypothetical protein
MEKVYNMHGQRPSPEYVQYCKRPAGVCGTPASMPVARTAAAATASPAPPYSSPPRLRPVHADALDSLEAPSRAAALQEAEVGQEPRGLRGEASPGVPPRVPLPVLFQFL